MGDSKMEEGLMNEFIGAGHADQAMLILDVPDEILENAAGSVREKAGAMTLAFCSGIDSCPSSVRA
jgi:hypothetical protein